MFNPTDEVRGEVFEIIEWQMRSEFAASQPAQSGNKSHQVNGYRNATREVLGKSRPSWLQGARERSPLPSRMQTQTTKI